MLPKDLATIREIQAAMQDGEKIPASRIRSWLHDAPVEVFGALTKLVLKHSRQIEPPLSMQEICAVVREYYKQVLTQEMQSEFAPPRSIAGHELVRWFRSLWSDASVPRAYLQDLKAMLAQVYKSGDQRSNEMLVNAVLEHLFETPDIVEFFRDWRSDPQMSNALALATEWTEKSPNPPGRRAGPPSHRRE